MSFALRLWLAFLLVLVIAGVMLVLQGRGVSARAAAILD